MNRDAKKWAKIEAEYRAGRKPTEIAKRYGVTLADIARRAREGKWDRPKEGAAEKPEPPKLLVRVADAPKPPPPKEDETAAIRRGHRRMMANLRAIFDRELAEMQGMLMHTASFLDEASIEELRQKALASKEGMKEYLDYLTNAVKVRKLCADLLEKLSRTGTQIIMAERTAAGIQDEKGNSGLEVTWDDLLAELQKPLAPNELPPNVVEFERRALGR